MINLKVDDENAILIIEMKGMVSEDDIDRAIDTLQQHYPGVGARLRGSGASFSALVDWQELEGWERGAKTLGTVTSKTFGDAVRKVAVIADKRFADEQPRLADSTSAAAVRFFAPGRRDDAMAWLQGR